MNTPDFFDDLIEALRAELQEYGELIALFDEQQSTILKSDPKGFLDLGSAVDDQISLVGAHRGRREDLVRKLNLTSGRPESTKLTDLLDQTPAEKKGMIKALIDEINALVARTQRCLRQNRLLLARCIETAQKLTAIAGNGNVISTYGCGGTVHRSVLISHHRRAVA
jgi:flagellar biosynthesis/type III secretory pathway chaperone